MLERVQSTMVLISNPVYFCRMSQELITLAHGAGGALMQKLIKDHILRYLAGGSFEVPVEQLEDSGVADGIVFTTDSYTVKPLFFPGGDIGRLAVAGTVNDIAVMGGETIALATSFILEEGFRIADLEKILSSIRATCDEAGTNVATGDTKVLEKGAIDKVVITCSGIGKRNSRLDHNIGMIKKYDYPFSAKWLLDSNLIADCKIIVSGTIGDHGMAVMSAREDYGFQSNIKSDAAPLNRMISKALEVGGVLAIKDPTRGGIANLLNEWSEKSHVGIMVHEDKIPVREEVKAALGFLGIDPLEVGNEGKVCLAVIPEKADEILGALRQTKEGENASIIGEATNQFDTVVLETLVGGKRIVPQPAGDPVPRIC